MPNYGIAPPDPSTDRGQLRYLIPDTGYEPVTPPPGHPTWNGDYDFFSDDALDVFLQRSNDDVDAAAILAWRQLGDYYASAGTSIQTDDLKVGESWKRAEFFYAKADAAEARLAGDVFALAPLGTAKKCHHAELAGFWGEGCGCA